MKKKHPGTAYVVASRAKTIGKVTNETQYPTKSNLFFIGTMGERRFIKCIYKENGEKCLLVKKREKWVQYLTTKIEGTKARRTKEAMQSSTKFVTSSLNLPTITSMKKLQERIVDMIHNPNDTWKLARQNYLVK